MTACSDSSLRFVLQEDSIYLKNLAALWAGEPRLARAIEALAAEDATDQYEIEASKSGAATLKVQTLQGRSYYVHSRFEPVDEARKMIDPINLENTVAFYVQGFGLGYHVEQLFDRCGDDTLICVCESNLPTLKLAFEQSDLTRIIECKRLLWFWTEDKAEIFSRLTPWQPSITMGFERIAHSAAMQLDPHFHMQISTWMDEFKAYAHTSVTTLVLNGKRTAENVASNLPWYVATPSITRLENRYKGKPAIIVSAGPSLRKNKHLLKDADGKSVIIAVQTTLQPLLEMGIEPNFVTSLDYHDISTRFWEKLPKTLKTELVAEPKASSAIFDLNPGPLSLLGNDFAESLLSELKLKKTKLRSGATVAHLAYYLAEHLGCDPIIFVGQDLGFSDGLCYTPGTSYEDVWRPELGRFCTVEMKQWEQIVRDRNILKKIPDQQGRPMYTEERLFTYLQHFERDFGQTKTRIIDASEGGALKRGTTPMLLKDAIAEYCSGVIVPPRLEYPGLQWGLLADCKGSLLNRRREAEQIEQISRDTLPLLKEVRDNLADQSRVNRAIANLDVLRAKISERSDCYGMIMQITQKSELQRFKADRRIAAAKVDGADRQRRQVERDIENVQSVVEASAEFQKLMDLSILRVEEFVRAHQRAEAA